MSKQHRIFSANGGQLLPNPLAVERKNCGRVGFLGGYCLCGGSFPLLRQWRAGSIVFKRYEEYGEILGTRC
jgi:hypothetical protein